MVTALNQLKYKKISNKTTIKIVSIFILFLVALFLYNYYDIDNLVTKDKLLAYLKPFGHWIPPVFLLIFNVAMLFNIPASVFLISISLLLGPIEGSFWGIIGCYSASIIVFILAKKIGLGKINQKIAQSGINQAKWELFNKKVEEDGFIYIALVRSSSLLPFSVIGYGSALTSIKTIDYIKGTLIGCLPQIILFCYIIPLSLTKDFNIKNILFCTFFILLWSTSFLIAFLKHRKKKKIAK